MNARTSSARDARTRLDSRTTYRPERGRLLLMAAALAAHDQARSAHAETAVSDARLTGPVDRVTLVAAAVARSPVVRAAAQQARAVQLEASAQGRLPPPEAMVWVWQVPLARPYALDTQMIMVGVTQTFPAPGSLAAREDAKGAEARAELAMADDASRQLVKDVEHTYASYVEASARHRIHRGHREVAERVLAIAQARHATGGSLQDVALAEVELAKVVSDLVTDATQVEAASARLNALLLRDPGAPLGPPKDEPPAGAGWDLATTLAKARAVQPEIRAAEAARRDALTRAPRLARGDVAVVRGSRRCTSRRRRRSRSLVRFPDLRLAAVALGSCGGPSQGGPAEAHRCHHARRGRARPCRSRRCRRRGCGAGARDDGCKSSATACSLRASVRWRSRWQATRARGPIC